MTTEMISLSEYRKNISICTKRANEQNICFIITSHGKPVGEYKPLGKKDIIITTKYSQDFIDELAEIEKEPSRSNLDDVFSITENTAAVFIEPLQAESGATTIDPNFLIAVAERCKKVGALLVLDEIQTGCGRLGTMWAFEQYDIVPDILLLAKALGGGMPIGAFISSHQIMHSLSHNPVLGHITTFGGNPVCCAAALATLKVLQNSDYISLVNSKESLFRSLLIHPKIKKITGKGLLLAIHLENAEEVQKIIKSCIKKGIISDWFLFAPHCVRIAPPLIISDEEIVWVCKELIGLLNE